MNWFKTIGSVADAVIEAPRKSVELAGDVAAKVVDEAAKTPDAILDAVDKVAKTTEGGNP